MDNATIALAQRLVTNSNDIEYFYSVNGGINATNKSWNLVPPTVVASSSPTDPNNKMRDGVGTTHHEAGTLFMGTAGNSTTDLFGKYHNISNAYAVGPSVFPTLGSANPSLTALALARRTALGIVSR